MLELTFGEQVKIVLSRKNMTIKQLAEKVEEKTGMKMSRQNLTQRLSRDNFQEQDMRMIAEILGCPFRLNILEISEDSQLSAVEKVEIENLEPIKETIKETIKEPVVASTAEPRKEKKKPAIEIVESNPNTNQRMATVEEVVPQLKQETLYSKEGEINPYTGFEYKTNSVRTHPKRIGYVEVYDRKDHKWTEMTEWAFLGFQERQKLLLGGAYIEPTYLD